MIKGLRKRPSYDELINELDKDFITKYPDRRAYEIENSNYMSQLRDGFQELVEQEKKIVGENVKQLLLKESTASSSHSHYSTKSVTSSLHHSVASPAGVIPPSEYDISSETEAVAQSEHSAMSVSSAQKEAKNVCLVEL